MTSVRWTEQDGHAARRSHMVGGAIDAHSLLTSDRFLELDEIDRCVGYIGFHDAWKLDLPYPPSSDWLAVCCFEGDALWPLHKEFGPLADLQRHDKNASPTLKQLTERAQSSLRNTLIHHRTGWPRDAEGFQDAETVIRTSEGARILRDLRNYWRI